MTTTEERAPKRPRNNSQDPVSNVPVHPLQGFIDRNKEKNLVVSLETFLKVDMPADVKLFLLGRSSPQSREAVLGRNYIAPYGLQCSRDAKFGTVSALLVGERRVPENLAELITVMDKVEDSVFAHAVKIATGDYLFTPRMQFDTTRIYTEACMANRVLPVRKTDDLEQRILNVLATMQFTPNQMQQVCISGLAVAHISNVAAPRPDWLMPLQNILHCNVSLADINAVTTIARIPQHALALLSLMRVSVLSTATNEEIVEAAWEQPLSSRSQFFVGTERLPQLLGVSRKNASFKSEAGEPVPTKRLSDCDNNSMILCTMKKMAFNQIAAFQKDDPLVYVVDADSVVYRKMGGGKIVRFVPKEVARAEVGFFKQVRDCLSRESKNDDAVVMDLATEIVVEQPEREFLTDIEFAF